MSEFLDSGMTLKKVGESWCRCPHEWGVEDFVLIRSSQGVLALCGVYEVLEGPERGKFFYEPLKIEQLVEI